MPVEARRADLHRVIARRPNRVLEFGDTRLHAETAVFDVRTSEVPSPRLGDRLDMGGETFVVQGEPSATAAARLAVDTRQASS